MKRRRFIIGAVQLCTFAACGGSSSEPEGDSGGDSTGGDGSTAGPSGSGTPTSASQSQSGSGESSTGDPGSSSSGPDTTTGATGSESSGSDGSSSSSDGTDTDAVCDPTPQDIEGPFYRMGIPQNANLDVHGDPGSTLTLDGIVFDTDCQPIEGAVVEIWHCTPLVPGEEAGEGDADYDGSDEYRYYGRVVTGEDGSYGFTTLRPAWYLNGMMFRPAHVHLKVWVDGTDVLTTQIYFADDPFADTDPWFNEDMAVEPDGAGAVTLDIVVVVP